MAAVIMPWHGDLWPSIRGFTGLSVEKQLEMSNWWPFKEKNLHSATEGPRLPACALAVWSVGIFPGKQVISLQTTHLFALFSYNKTYSKHPVQCFGSAQASAQTF